MPFSERMKYEREQRGWSQAKLAELLGVTPNRISTWERGLSLPSSYARQELFTLLGKNASELELLPDAYPQQEQSSSSDIQQQLQLSFNDSNRHRLLAKVHAFWIKDTLEQSLHTIPPISLAFYELPHAVTQPWQEQVRQPDMAGRHWAMGTPITHIYEQAGNELLLLGEPGSGKTTLLLELAHDLLKEATRNEGRLLPVVFHLSSWAQKRLPLSAWLVEELHEKYQVPRKQGFTWIQADQILLLLDGLDEVATTHRLACVEAINAYREEHGLVPMVVCSRSTDYLALPKRLLLHRAILIESLTTPQIDAYLLSRGKQEDAVRQSLHEDAALYQLATTPLMLSILAQVDCKQTDQKLLDTGTLEAQRKQLFATYVRHMLQRRGSSSRYTQQQTIHWLGWLAKQMQRQHQAEISIERMQPDWLPMGRWQHMYQLLTRGMAGLLFGLISGLVFGTLLQWIRGDFLAPRFFYPMFGLCLIGGLLQELTDKRQPDIEASQAPRRWKELWRQGLRTGTIFLAVFGSGGALFFSKQLIQQQGWAIGLGASLFLFLLIGLPSALISALLAIAGFVYQLDGPIQPVETISWSWMGMKRKLFKSVLRTLLFASPLGILAGLLVGISSGMLNGVITLAGIELMVGIFGGLLVGLATGFSKELLPPNELLRPNEGIRRSVSHSLLFGGCAALLVGGGIWLLVVLLSLLTSALGLAADGQGFVALVIERFSFAILPGLLAGLGSGLINGGKAALQHMILRLLLWLSGSAPLNYPRFLNYAVERLLLRPLGGSYIFIHRLLLDYCVALYTIPDPYTEKESTITMADRNAGNAG